jgi:hypothetical protein
MEEGRREGGSGSEGPLRDSEGGRERGSIFANFGLFSFLRARMC